MSERNATLLRKFQKALNFPDDYIKSLGKELAGPNRKKIRAHLVKSLMEIGQLTKMKARRDRNAK